MRTLIFVLALFANLVVRGEDTPPLMSRALLHNTILIEFQKITGQSGLGTGFFYYFAFTNGGKTSTIPVIVTCWHVVSNAAIGRIHLALGTTNALVRSQDDFPLVFQNFESFWIRHPDTNVDLAVMPLGPILHAAASDGKTLDLVPIDERDIPTKDELFGFGVFQEIKFIGYPEGIWDQKNNLPIVRRGMTATDPAVDYNGHTEFLIDAAVFPGSSGSPVYVAEEGGRVVSAVSGNAHGLSFAGPRFKLLGILYAVEEYTSEGNVDVVTIPTSFDIKVNSRIPANLGLVIKAERLNDFRQKFEEIEKTHTKMIKNGMSTPPTNAIARPANH